MAEFNAGRVLAEAYTLYKKHHDGMGLDFKIAIAQIRKEAKTESLRDAAESNDLIGHMYREYDDHPLRSTLAPANVRATSNYLHNRADQMEGDDETH